MSKTSNGVIYAIAGFYFFRVLQNTHPSLCIHSLQSTIIHDKLYDVPIILQL